MKSNSKDESAGTKPDDPQSFIEGTDYYLDEDGRFVFTALYLKKRGYCCKNGCRHCPYGYKAKEEP